MEIKRFGNLEGKAMKHQHFDVETAGFLRRVLAVHRRIGLRGHCDDW